MFQMLTTTAPAPPSTGAEPAAWSLGSLLARALDEVDFGIVLVAEDGAVLHLNHRARHALCAEQGLQLLANRLHTRDPRSMARLQHALHDAARRGLRRLLALGHGDEVDLWVHQVDAQVLPGAQARQLHRLATHLEDAVLGVVGDHERHRQPVVRRRPQALEPEQRRAVLRTVPRSARCRLRTDVWPGARVA